LREAIATPATSAGDSAASVTSRGAPAIQRPAPMPGENATNSWSLGSDNSWSIFTDSAAPSAPADAGRLATLCMEHGETDRDLMPLISGQYAAIERQRADLDRVQSELADLELTIAAAGRARLSSEGIAVSVNPIRVLFVCTGNSARSQIAEALLKDFGGSDFEVSSAGTEPRELNPQTITVLGEIGICWSGAQSKSATQFLGQPFDYVITVCDRARQTCQVFPGDHNSLHWGLDDPAEVEGTEDEKLEAFRRIRTEVAVRLRPFVELARKARRETVPAH
jgi:arsenate reductase (thioredoxin)